MNVRLFNMLHDLIPPSPTHQKSGKMPLLLHCSYISVAQTMDIMNVICLFDIAYRTTEIFNHMALLLLIKLIVVSEEKNHVMLWLSCYKRDIMLLLIHCRFTLSTLTIYNIIRAHARHFENGVLWDTLKTLLKISFILLPPSAKHAYLLMGWC